MSMCGRHLASTVEISILSNKLAMLLVAAINCYHCHHLFLQLGSALFLLLASR